MAKDFTNQINDDHLNQSWEYLEIINYFVCKVYQETVRILGDNVDEDSILKSKIPTCTIDELQEGKRSFSYPNSFEYIVDHKSNVICKESPDRNFKPGATRMLVGCSRIVKDMFSQVCDTQVNEALEKLVDALEKDDYLKLSKFEKK